MDPQSIARNYDRIAQKWHLEHRESSYGVSQLKRALSFAAAKGPSIDIGCGSSGRFIQACSDSGFEAEGLDISAEMIRVAKEFQPTRTFHHVDVSTWSPEKSYVLITAWDSTFHLPLELQEPVTRKLCRALAPGGVFLFTCGSPHGSISGSFDEMDFEYSSLGVNGFLRILLEENCEILHVEHDQLPEKHVTVISRLVERR